MQTYINTQYCNSGSKRNRYGVRLTVNQNSQNITNNTSNITVTFELGGAGALGLTTDYTGSSMNGFTYYGNIYINGTSVATGSHTGNMNNSTVATIATWTGNVSHNADGSLAIPVRGVFTGGSSSQANGGEASGTVYLDTIPRASSVSCTTADIGTKPTITITSATSSFTHKLYYSFGSIEKTLITDSGLTGNTTITYNSWTIPTTFYAQMPDVQTAQGFIYCETYSDGTFIGDSLCPLTVNVPSTAKPNISVPTIVDTDTVSKDTIKLYVIGKSKLKFTFPAFSTNYSSTLQSYILKINGTQVYAGSSNTYTMSAPLSQASNTYELIIVDSRGLSNTTGSKTLTTAYAYNEPKITLFTAERNSEVPTTVDFVYSGTIKNINNNNKNAKKFKIEYKLSTANTWSAVTGDITDAYTKTNATANKTGLSEDSSYDFRITAVDSYNVPITVTTHLSTSDTLLNFNKNGKTMAFGKASEVADTIEFGIKTDFQKPILLSDTIQGKQLTGGSGTAGYMNCFSLSTTGAYQNQALTFDVIQRSRSGRVRLILNSSATAGTATVNQCYFEGNISVHYLASNNIVTVYIQKSEAYDSIEIVNFKKGKYMGNTSITWNNTTVGKLPVGYKSGSRRAGEFYYGITSTVGDNSSSNLMTSQGVYNTVLPITPVILYDNSSGTNDTVTLSDSAANYSYLEIYYGSTQNSVLRWDYTKLFSPNGKSFMCKVHWIYDTNGSTQTVTEVNTISGNQITRGESSCWNVDHSGSTWTGSYGVRTFYIFRVVGYK
jgi:hypothetical protein